MFDIEGNIIDSENCTFTSHRCDWPSARRVQIITIIFYDKELIIDQATNWRATTQTTVRSHQNITAINEQNVSTYAWEKGDFRE